MNGWIHLGAWAPFMLLEYYDCIVRNEGSFLDVWFCVMRVFLSFICICICMGYGYDPFCLIYCNILWFWCCVNE